MKRRTALIALPISLAGCASSSGVIDGNSLSPGEGILALQVSTNATSGFIGLAPYTPSRAAGIMREMFSVVKENFSLSSGDTYFVRHLAAGDYMWNELVVGPKRAVLYSTSKMTVKAGVVTYVGHIRLSTYERSYEMKVLDRENEMREYLVSNFPKLMASYSLEKNLANIGLAPA